MNKIIQSNTQQSLTSSYQLHVDRRALMSCYRDCMNLPLPLSLSIPASFTGPSNQFQRRTGSCTLVLAPRLNNHHRKSHRRCKALIFTCGLCVRARVGNLHSPVASLRKPIFTWAHSALLANCTPAPSKYFTFITWSSLPRFKATCGFEEGFQTAFLQLIQPVIRMLNALIKIFFPC